VRIVVNNSTAVVNSSLLNGITARKLATKHLRSSDAADAAAAMATPHIAPLIGQHSAQ